MQSAISTLSFSELEAIIHIFDELGGTEGILVASKVADRVGITRSVIVNALRKFFKNIVVQHFYIGSLHTGRNKKRTYRAIGDQYTVIFGVRSDYSHF